MEGSVLSFLKAECKVSNTGSAQCRASSFYLFQMHKHVTNDLEKHLRLALVLDNSVVRVYFV